VDPPIQNEFSPLRSNVRGTIAMAKSDGDPDSATSEWFFNLADNGGVPPDGLDFQNGGFTVFGCVLDTGSGTCTGTGTGMDLVDAIAGLQVLDYSSAGQAFGALPVINYNPPNLSPNNLVQVTSIPNVASAQTPSGAWAIFTTDVELIFNSVGIVDTATAVSQLASFTSPPDQSVHFNNGMYTFSMTGVIGPAGSIVTMYDGASVRPTHYYAYGPTPDDPSPHWYDFAFDGETGAEIMGDKIILHFVDGQRGDEDLTANNSITHTGAQAVVTSTSSTDAQSGGCSIVSTPSQTMRGGDWIALSLFLAFVAFVRRRTRRQRF
jgi:cyclophilin family peptidyl-prolyl cis-trans isomerase